MSNMDDAWRLEGVTTSDPERALQQLRQRDDGLRRHVDEFADLDEAAKLNEVFELLGTEPLGASGSSDRSGSYRRSTTSERGYEFDVDDYEYVLARRRRIELDADRTLTRRVLEEERARLDRNLLDRELDRYR
jgi:hypothetical protein